MKNKPNILKLETHEYLLDVGNPKTKDIIITYKGKQLNNVIAIILDSQCEKLE